MKPSSFIPLCLIVVLTHCSFVWTESSEFIWRSLVNISSETLEKAFLPNYIDLHNIVNDESINPDCKSDFQKALKALESKQNWAFQMFDSWAKFPPSGVLSGTFTDFGDYDQCLSIEDLTPQYCLLDLALPMPQPMPKYHNYYQKSQVLPDDVDSNKLDFSVNGTLYRHLADISSVFYYVYLQIGICIPNSCTSTDIKVVASKQSEKIGLKFKRYLCESKNHEQWKPDGFQLLAIIVLIISFGVTIISATYDRVVSKKSGTLSERILLWFSPSRNIRKLVCTKSNDELTCIHGIRFITIAWIIICHTLEWNNLNIFKHTFFIKDKLSALDKQPLYKGHYSVDTFFYLSGLLTSYVTIKYTFGDYKNFKYISFFVLRYLRLTPQLGMFLLLSSLLPPLFDGPLWNTYMNKLTDKCYITWWHNLIYLHNIIDIRNICAIHTWYLAADMQLHWMSILPVVFLLRNHNKGIMVTKFMILVCICISSATLFIQKLPPGSVITSKNDFLDEDGRPSDFIKFFYKPWNHANVFFIGFIFGAYIQNTNLHSTMLKTSTKYLLWLVCFGGYLFCMYSTVPWLYGKPYDPFWSAILFPLNRTVWACVLTLVVWLCLTKNGSIIGRFLSWAGFRVFSRLTYSVYLTHAWVLWVALGSRRELIDLSTRSIIFLCAALIFISYVVGFIFTILFETPLIHVIEYIKHTWLQQNENKSNGNIMENNNTNQDKDSQLLNIQSSSV